MGFKAQMRYKLLGKRCSMLGEEKEGRRPSGMLEAIRAFYAVPGAAAQRREHKGTCSGILGCAKITEPGLDVVVRQGGDIGEELGSIDAVEEHAVGVRSSGGSGVCHQYAMGRFCQMVRQ